MSMRRHCYHFLIVIVLALSLTGCAFHPRSAADIPPQLHHVFLDTKNPYSAFTTQFKAMLRSLNITLDKTRHLAPYTIKITHYKFSQSNPPITTTSLAVTFTYSISLKISIQSQSGKTIEGPRSLGASRSLVQSASQVYTPGTATLTKQELQRDVISQIYYFLVSEDTRHALDKFNKRKTKYHAH